MMGVETSRKLVAVLSLTVVLCVGDGAAQGSAQADRSADPLPSGRPLSPRIAAQSSNFELVGVAQGKNLTIYLDRFSDNAPVVGATLDVTTGGRSMTAVAVDDGIYRLSADWVARAGHHDVTVAITSDQGIERVVGALAVPSAPAGATQPAVGSWPAQGLSMGTLLAFLLGMLATLALRHVSNLSAVANHAGNRLRETANRTAPRIWVAAARARVSLSRLRDGAGTLPIGKRLAGRPVEVSVAAAALGLVALAVIALLLGRTVLAHAADAQAAPTEAARAVAAAPADPAPATTVSAVDGIAADSGPRRLLDGSLFVPKASQRLLNVRTVIARTSEVSRTVQMVGRVIADPGMSGEIHASIRGRLEPIGGAWPKVGQHVQAGDVLAWVVPVVNPIDRGIVLQQVAQVDREMGLTRDRINRLGVARDEVPARELGEARANLANLVRRREAIAAVIRDRDTLRAPLVAPSTGIIASSFAVTGQVVDEQQKLFEVVDLKRLWVEAYAYDVAAMGTVLKANARSAAGGTYHLKFVSRGPQLQRQTIPLYFQLDDPDPGISVGTLLSVLVETSGERSGIVLPPSAIVRSTAGQDVVWQHVDPESFVPVPVRTEPIDGNNVLVPAGLATETRIVVDGADLLNEVR
jgi:membrane fusion protein, heavy metal efflux system